MVRRVSGAESNGEGPTSIRLSVLEICQFEIVFFGSVPWRHTSVTSLRLGDPLARSRNTGILHLLSVCPWKKRVFSVIMASCCVVGCYNLTGNLPTPRDEFAPISEGLCLAQAEQCTIAAIKRHNYLLDNLGTSMEILRVYSSHFEELDFQEEFYALIRCGLWWLKLWCVLFFARHTVKRQSKSGGECNISKNTSYCMLFFLFQSICRIVLDYITTKCEAFRNRPDDRWTAADLLFP